MTAEAFCQSALPKCGPFMLGHPTGRIQNHHVIFHCLCQSCCVFPPLFLIHNFFYWGSKRCLYLLDLFWAGEMVQQLKWPYWQPKFDSQDSPGRRRKQVQLLIAAAVLWYVQTTHEISKYKNSEEIISHLVCVFIILSFYIYIIYIKKSALSRCFLWIVGWHVAFSHPTLKFPTRWETHLEDGWGPGSSWHHIWWLSRWGPRLPDPREQDRTLGLSAERGGKLVISRSLL